MLVRDDAVVDLLLKKEHWGQNFKKLGTKLLVGHQCGKKTAEGL